MLHTETVTADTLAVIKRLMADNELSDFTLVGGTALALHIGHRTSIDIDLFSIKISIQRKPENMKRKTCKS